MFCVERTKLFGKNHKMGLVVPLHDAMFWITRRVMLHNVRLNIYAPSVLHLTCSLILLLHYIIAVSLSAQSCNYHANVNPTPAILQYYLIVFFFFQNYFEVFSCSKYDIYRLIHCGYSELFVKILLILFSHAMLVNYIYPTSWNCNFRLCADRCLIYSLSILAWKRG